jgi:hypothetical protein
VATQGLLARLGRANPTAVFLTTAALVLGGLLAPRPYGGLILAVLATAVAALVTVTWSRGTSSRRAARLAILALLIALTLYRLF